MEDQDLAKIARSLYSGFELDLAGDRVEWTAAPAAGSAPEPSTSIDVVRWQGSLGRVRLAPASSIQQRFWFLYRLQIDSSFYNVPVQIRLRGPLEVAALRWAALQLAQRHEILRTRFEEWDGYVVQIISPLADLQLEILDLGGSNESEEEKEEEGRRRIAFSARQPFQLDRGPAHRLHLIRLGSQDHLLLLNFHHIVADEVSAEMYLSELAEVYNQAFSGQAGLDFRSAATPYRQFSSEERAGRFAERMAHDFAHWKRYARPALPLQHLLDGAATEAGSADAVAHRVDEVLSSSMSRRIEATCQELEVTPLAMLLALSAGLLGELIGLDAVSFGVPVSVRSQGNWASVFGPLINTVPVLVGADPKCRVAEASRQAVDGLSAAVEHPWLALDQLGQQIGAPRLADGPALFTAVVSSRRRLDRSLDFRNLQAESLPAPTVAPKFPFVIFLTVDEQIRISVEHNPSLLSDAFAALFLRRLVAAVERFLGDGDCTVGDACSAGGAEIEELLRVARGPLPPYPDQPTVHQHFSSTAAAHPDRPAVTWSGGQLSYRELEDASSRLAGVLRSAGVGRGSIVAFMAERSPRMVVGLLAILKTGGAYLPLDPSFPTARLQYMLDDTRAGIALCDRASASFLAPIGCRLVLLDDAEDQPGDAAAVGGSSEDLAYVMFTSGSTGRPKPVAISHRGILRLACANGAVRPTAEDVVLHASTLAFDASTFEIWSCLLNGARLALMPPGPMTFRSLAETVREHEVTVALLSTGLFQHVVADDAGALRGLEQVLVGGDVLRPSDVEAFQARVPGARLFNAYGPTESTTIATCHEVPRDAPLADRVPIGGPIGHTETFVVDRRLKMRPPRIAGELAIGGDGLAWGYLGRPALTAEKFVPDGISGRPGARLYLSGDLVRAGDDGVLEFRGRRDRQVKIRGFRVELEEVETVLGETAQIEEAVVEMVGEQDPRRLVAFVVRAGDSDVDLEQASLKRTLRSSLPEYMIPQEIVTVDRLPRGSNGKIDRKALTRAFVSRDAAPSGREGSWIERLLRDIWADVLGRQDVALDGDFFALGGNSLNLMRVLSRIRSVFDVDLPVQELYRAPTVRALAEVVRRRLRSPVLEAGRASPLQPDGTGVDVVRLAGREDAERRLLCLHPAGGHLLDYRDLGRALARRGIATFGIQAPALDGGTTYGSLEEMASAYLEACRQRFGPGLPALVGYCSGGLTAFEMARQLSQASEPLAALILVDTPPTSHLLGRAAGAGEEPVSVPREIAAGFATEILLDTSSMRYTSDDLDVLLASLWAAFRADNAALAEELGWTRFERLFRTYAANSLASLRYEPAPYEGCVVALEAEQTLVRSCSGWRDLVGSHLRCRQIPGNHVTCLREPLVDGTAAILDEMTAVSPASEPLAPASPPPFPPAAAERLDRASRRR